MVFVACGPLFGGGCGASGDEDVVHLSGGCDPLRTCDIRDQGCQEQIYKATACLNEVSLAQPPDVRTISLADFEAELRARPGEPSPGDEGMERALQLLGLLPSEMTPQDALNSAQAAGVAAYYDPKTKGVSVIDRGADQDSGDSLFLLAHEFTHAQRDQKSDLDAFRRQWSTSTDRYVAILALVEGEANAVGMGVYALSQNHTVADIRWSVLGDTFLSSMFASMQQSEVPFFTAVQSLPYGIGSGVIGPQWEDGGSAAIDALYEEPLVSVLEYMEYGNDVSIEPFDCYPTMPPPGYSAETHDSFGAVGVLALPVALAGSDPASAYEQSKHWRGDSVVIFRADDAMIEDRAVAWRIAFDSSAAASAFSASVRSALLPGAQIMAVDHEVLIAAASDAATLQAWSDVGACGSQDDLPDTSADMMDGMKMAAHRIHE